MPPEPPQRPNRVPAWTSSRRLRWWLAGSVVAVLAVRAALPLALELAGERFGSALLGRRVEIADVDLALLSGVVVVEELAVGPLGRPGESPPEFAAGEGHFTLARLTADLGWLALLRGEVQIERVELVEPGWLILRDATGHLVPVLLPREEEPEEPPPDEEAGPGPTVRLDLLRLTGLDVRYLDMARPDAVPLRFELAELRLDGLVRRGSEIQLGAIGLREPSLRVLRDIDLSFLAGGPEAGDAPAPEEAAPVVPEPATQSAPPALHLDRVAVETARFLLVTPDGEVSTSLALNAEDVTLDRDATFPVRAQLGLEDGEIVIEGEAGASPPAFAGTLEWRGLPLATIAGAAGDLSPLRIDAGSSSGALRIDARVDDQAPSGIAVSGRLGVAGLSLADRTGDLSLGWSQLDVGLTALELDPTGERAPRVDLSEVVLQAPQVRAVRRAGAAEPDAPPAEPASTTEPGARPQLRLARLEVRDGEVEFADETVQPPHRSRVVALQVQGAGLEWPGQQAESLTVSFAGPEAARFALDATRTGEAARAHLELDELGLPPFSPYAAELAGYRLEDGVLTLEADVEVDGPRTKLESDLDLLHLDVAEVAPGSFEKQFGVSMDLGLALLRDPRGRIDLPIRAAVGEGGTRLSITALFVSALRQAILGALTSPLKTAGLLLGRERGTGGMRLEPVSMAAGSAEPSAADVEALARFVRVLESRPGLALELHGAVAPEDDRALAEKILGEQVVADAELPPMDAGFLQRRRLRRALEERAEGGEGELEAEDAEALERWVAKVQVPEARRLQLANARAEAVRASLLDRHGVDPGRVRLGDPRKGEPGVVVGLAPAGP